MIGTRTIGWYEDTFRIHSRFLSFGSYQTLRIVPNALSDRTKSPSPHVPRMSNAESLTSTPALPNDDVPVSRVAHKRERDDPDGDAYFERQVREWEEVQLHFHRALNQPLAGMLTSGVNIEASFLRHKIKLMTDGYKFNTYEHDRSLFERLDRLVFAYTASHRWAFDVLQELRNMLYQINKDSKPERDRFSMLVMMNTKYVTAVANLILLLAHTKATVDDLDLFWELTDRIWCFAHPVYTSLTSIDLDETCAKIAARLEEVTSDASSHAV